jgi:hypothetical protein
MTEQTWDEFERAPGTPQGPHSKRGYREEFEPGDLVVFPQHMDARVREVEYRLGEVLSASMTVLGVEDYQEIPDHRLVEWGMMHSPGHWRAVAQKQAVAANESCFARLTVTPGIYLECRRQVHTEGGHSNSWTSWDDGDQCMEPDPSSGAFCIATVPGHLTHRSWDLCVNTAGPEWPRSDFDGS